MPGLDRNSERGGRDAPTVTDVNRLFCVGLRGLNNPDIVATDVDPLPPGPTHTDHHTGKCPLLTVEAAWKNCSNSDGNYRTPTLLNTNCCRPTTNRGGPTRLKISWSMRQTTGPGRHLLLILHCPQESTDLKHERIVLPEASTERVWSWELQVDGGQEPFSPTGTDGRGDGGGRLEVLAVRSVAVVWRRSLQMEGRPGAVQPKGCRTKD
ncbi:unnamed protein product [Arctogadus glacialis]